MHLKQSASTRVSGRLSSAPDRSQGWGPRFAIIISRYFLSGLMVLGGTLVSPYSASAQQTDSQPAPTASIQGMVRTAGGEAVSDASVHLEQTGASKVGEAKTDSKGEFAFASLGTGTYIVSAEKSGRHSRSTAVITSFPGDQQHVVLQLEGTTGAQPGTQVPSGSSSAAMEFSDAPHFTVAAVTDWTAAGGHGSDSSLRTSESLTRETLGLKPKAESDSAGSSTASAAAKKSEAILRAAVASAPASFESNHDLGEFYLQDGRYRQAVPLLQAAYRIDQGNAQNEYDLAQALKADRDLAQARMHVQNLLVREKSAGCLRLAGEIDEQLGDPLSAVHEFEQAAHVDPSEENYFSWGSELLLHRAVWQAKEVFSSGVKRYPQSARLLTALGAALFAGALYDEAALRLCDASALDPANPEPYLFMGKIAIAAPSPLPCIEPKLKLFTKTQPANPLADYYYAMALWKENGRSITPQVADQVEGLLTRAVAIDPRCSDAYLQLGILHSSEHQDAEAIEFYLKAVSANPQMSEAHYRLGLAYDRMGERAKAEQELRRHDEIEKEQAAVVERERRAIKQFLIVVQEPSTPAPN